MAVLVRALFFSERQSPASTWSIFWPTIWSALTGGGGCAGWSAAGFAAAAGVAAAVGAAGGAVLPQPARIRVSAVAIVTLFICSCL